MLKVARSNVNDTSITGIQYQMYSPYTTSFKNQDEIHITIQSQNAYLFPHESSIYIEGTLNHHKKNKKSTVLPATTESTTTPPTIESVEETLICENMAAFLFDSIRYELNGVEIDKCRNVGITSLLKGNISYTPNEIRGLSVSTFGISVVAKASTFSAIIPLRMLFGFAEDYKSIILNMKHDLIMLRSRSDANCFLGPDADEFSISIDKLQWRMPHVKLDDSTQLKMMKQIESDDPIEMAFRSWDLHEYPVLPKSTKQVWSVKTSSSLTTPRYVIVAFQTARYNQRVRNVAKFDQCNINDIKLYLNSSVYPQESMNLDFIHGRMAILYEMYTKFRQSYYHDDRTKNNPEPYLSIASFAASPIFVFDCSRQNESIKTSSVDIRVEIEASVNIPDNTTAYCLILHDNIVKYKPLSSLVYRNI